MRNLLERDRLFTERLPDEAADYGLASIVVDGRQSEDQLLCAIESHFLLAAAPA